MPVFQKLVDFNYEFNTLPEPPIIINDLANTTLVDKNIVQQLVTTRYSSDMITLLPSCRCGITKGEYSINVICPHCNTPVKSNIEEDFYASVWFRKPTGVAKLINPIILIMLKNRFRKSGFNVIQWLTDTTYRSQTKQPKIIEKLISTGLQRGYNNFINNFDSIYSYLSSLKELQPQKTQKEKDQVDYLTKLITENRNAIFSDYIPLPNKSLLVVEKTVVGTYVDPNIASAIDAVEMLVSIDRDFYDQTQRTKENRTAKALMKLTDFYEKFHKENMSKKEALLRKHLYGSRTNFSFRAVITSLTDKHNYQEIHIPWGIGLTVFRPHLINKLLDLGYDLNSSIALLLGHIEQHNPLLEKLLNELLEESPEHSIPCIIQRN